LHDKNLGTAGFGFGLGFISFLATVLSWFLPVRYVLALSKGQKDIFGYGFLLAAFVMAVSGIFAVLSILFMLVGLRSGTRCRDPVVIATKCLNLPFVLSVVAILCVWIGS
jgi:hypothetical protein